MKAEVRNDRVRPLFQREEVSQDTIKPDAGSSINHFYYYLLNILRVRESDDDLIEWEKELDAER